MHFFKFGFWDVVDLIPSKIFIALMVLNRVAALFTAVLKRDKTFVVSAGILIILSGIVINYFYRFEGIMSAGEGEITSVYDSHVKGLFGKPPKIFLQIGAIDAETFNPDSSSKVQLVNEKGESVVLSLGQSTKLASGVKIMLKSIQTAPKLLIKDRADVELFSGFAKLILHPMGAKDYITIDIWPHRFYVSLTGEKDKPFRLEIMRGKLMLINRQMAMGEQVEIEGLKVSFVDVAKWIEIKVESLPGNRLTVIGVVISIVGLVVYLFSVLKRR